MRLLVGSHLSPKCRVGYSLKCALKALGVSVSKFYATPSNHSVKISTQALTAFSQCRRKAHLLMCRNKKGAQHEYFQILERRRVAAQRVFVENQLGRPIASLEGIPIIEGAAYLTNVFVGHQFAHRQRPDALQSQWRIVSRGPITTSPPSFWPQERLARRHDSNSVFSDTSLNACKVDDQTMGSERATAEFGHKRLLDPF